MATNNSINAPEPFAVNIGGSGVASHTAYMPVCGGTTTTGAEQSVATGTQGQTLIYNTSASLPSFSGYSLALSSYISTGVYCATGLGHMQSSGALTAAGITAGVGYIVYFPFLCQQTHAFTSIETYVVTGIAASHTAFAMYADSGVGTPTGSPLANSSSGTLSSATSAAILGYTFGVPITLIGGQIYWLAMTSSSASITYAASPTNADQPNGLNMGSVSASVNHTIGYVQSTAGYSATFPAVSGANPFTQGNQLVLIYLTAQ